MILPYFLIFIINRFKKENADLIIIDSQSMVTFFEYKILNNLLIGPIFNDHSAKTQFWN